MGMGLCPTRPSRAWEPRIKDHCCYAGDHAEEPSICLDFHYRLESVRFEEENEYEYEI